MSRASSPISGSLHPSEDTLRRRVSAEARDFVREARSVGHVVTIGMLVEAIYDTLSLRAERYDDATCHRIAVLVLCDVADWAGLDPVI